MKNIIPFESFDSHINEKKEWGKSEKGLMHEVLGIPGDKKIKDVYKKDGEKLAKDLLISIKRKKIVPIKEVRSKATSMLAFAANWPNDGKNSLMDRALSSIKKIQIPGVPLSK